MSPPHRYFEKLKNVLYANRLLERPEGIFNVNGKEIRLTTSVGKKKRPHNENVVVIACVNAVGNVIPPMVLFKGRKGKPEWADELPSGSEVQIIKNGNITAPIFLQWLKHFYNFKPAGECSFFFLHQTRLEKNLGTKYRLSSSCL